MSTPVPRLSATVLNKVPPDVQLPKYARQGLTIGIVHLGIGAFHRAHQAWYTDAALNLTPGPWGILGVSLRSPTVGNQLNPQDGLYTLVEQSEEGEKLQVLGAIRGVLIAPQDPEAVLTAMCEPSVRILSLTITEKGYCHDPASGKLNLQHPDIQHDLSNPAQPRTAIGFIVESLRRRFAAGQTPFTALTCDNLPDNGALLRQMVLSFAAQRDAILAEQIAQHVSFPSTMVDRIVPATTAEDIQALTQKIGLLDQGMVKTEPFSQWVIEDSFVNGRPPWEQVGAHLVDDVAPFEEVKLRLLNGSHSAIAYLGYVGGYKTVAQAITDRHLRHFIKTLMDHEISVTVNPPAELVLEDYQAALLARFSNPALAHKTYQIAMDGSQKIPQRWLNTLIYLRQNELPCQRMALCLAAWLRYQLGQDDLEQSYSVEDPFAGALAACIASEPAQTEHWVQATFALSEIFPKTLRDDNALQQQVSFWLGQLLQNGVRQTLQHFDTLAAECPTA